jgi:DNA sulfur modification protein DndD
MFLRSIELRDWKAYASGRFEFPVPTRNKNVVLIGAKNGYGKTSLLEAIILGLYGRDGMHALARAVTSNSDEDKSYDEFMERALHAQALAQGRTSIAITIVLDDATERLKIVRRWHFTGGGKHRRTDEEVNLFSGKDDEPVKVPGLRPSREDRDDFYRSEIARKFIPFHLTEFFLFDGERVQQLAKQQKAGMIKEGVEGILGVQLLRVLQGDLMAYAQERRRGVENIEDETLVRVNNQITEIEARLEPCQQRLKDLEDQLAPITRRIEELTRTVRTMTGGNSANVKELMENQFNFRRQRERVEERLNQMLRTDLALALAGKPLRDRVASTISSEIKRMEWQASKNHTREKLDRILAGLEAGEPTIEPDLTEHQLVVLRQRLSAVWETLWHPPPTGCEGEDRHTYLTEGERRKVIERLDRIEKLGVSELEQLLQDHDDATVQFNRLGQQIAGLSGVEDRIKDDMSELERLNQQAGRLREQMGDLTRQEQADTAELGRLRAEAGRMAARYESAQPSLARAAKAEKIATLISEAIEDLYPKYVARLGEEMTSVYRQLAHKSLVKRIEIAPDCTVKLLGDKGHDIRTMDSSAGEEQIFALSLIAAIAKVSGTKVPIVMDTPLARLDNDHRSNVLRYFAAQAGEQVIFLSQPDEVNGEYLRVIRDRVCKAYHIEFEELDNGVGKAHVRKGYFQSEEF